MYVERGLKDRFDRLRGAYGAIAVVGARQSGKTTFLREQAKKLKHSYVTFDDPDAKRAFDRDVKRFELQYLKGNDVSVLDEVQYCRSPGQKLKYLVDAGHKLWVTSSSQSLLEKGVLSFLVGRITILRMYPFSLDEFMKAKSQKILDPEILERLTWEHMAYGGYPKVVTEEDVEVKKTLLRDIYDTTTLKDIARTFSIEDVNPLNDIAKYVAANVGGMVSYDNISKLAGISFRTVKKYFDALERSYIIARAPPFSTNKGKEIYKQPKAYFVDTGIMHSVTNAFPTSVGGKLFENYVFSEILKAGFQPKFWRSKAGAEVDFIVEKGNDVIPVEVKLTASRVAVERSMKAFINSYEPEKAFVVSYRGVGGKAKVGGCEVIFTDIAGLLDGIK